MEDLTKAEAGAPQAGVELLRWWLSAGVAAAYGGFLLLGWLLGPALGQPALGRVPWSFLLGTGLLGAIVATMGAYVLISNRGETP